MSLKRKILLLVFLALAAIQFIRPARNKSGQVLPADIFQTYSLPDSVLVVLRKSCYDCHSNNTAYPWYTHVQPIGWFMDWHIKDGKHELNFSEFGGYSPKRQASKLKSIAASIEDGTMPLPSYLWMHTNARLTDREKTLLTEWVLRTRDSLSK